MSRCGGRQANEMMKFEQNCSDTAAVATHYSSLAMNWKIKMVQIKNPALRLGSRTVSASRHLLAAVAAIATLLDFSSNGLAQTAAEHAAQAHGRPIVNGRRVQPTPADVERRLRHHEQMLQAERDGSVRPQIAHPDLRSR